MNRRTKKLLPAAAAALAMTVGAAGLAATASATVPTGGEQTGKLNPVAVPQPGAFQVAGCNGCNPCNPCGTKKKDACNPCNPCGASSNPCNPCGASNPCNPCGAN